MARLPRLAVTDAAHLVVWRGHNGQPVFVDDDDRQAWLASVAESAAREGVAWHGHALLVSALWMLATPRREGALSRWMQALGRTYVRRFNQRHGRRGTLWDGRYRAAVLAPDWVLPRIGFFGPRAGVGRAGRHAGGLALVEPPPLRGRRAAAGRDTPRCLVVAGRHAVRARSRLPPLGSGRAVPAAGAAPARGRPQGLAAGGCRLFGGAAGPDWPPHRTGATGAPPQGGF
jgi:hypothetical protein